MSHLFIISSLCVSPRICVAPISLSLCVSSSSFSNVTVLMGVCDSLVSSRPTASLSLSLSEEETSLFLGSHFGCFPRSCISYTYGCVRCVSVCTCLCSFFLFCFFCCFPPFTFFPSRDVPQQVFGLTLRRFSQSFRAWLAGTCVCTSLVHSYPSHTHTSMICTSQLGISMCSELVRYKAVITWLLDFQMAHKHTKKECTLQ